MLSFYGLIGRSSSGISSGFVEFSAGINQSLIIPSGVSRVRVHLIGGGGAANAIGSTNGGSSTFSAAGVSVIASGGYLGDGGSTSGNGGSVNAVAGVVGQGVGGIGGRYATPDGQNGTIGVDVGLGMGGGGGGMGYYIQCICGAQGAYGYGGQVGLNPSSNGGGQYDYLGGAGGGYGSGQTLPIYGSNGGAGQQFRAGGSGISAGGGGGYAMFYVNVSPSTTYTSAITVGAGGTTNIYGSAQSGYCRVEWGTGI
jgi:hypothetical protein